MIETMSPEAFFPRSSWNALKAFADRQAPPFLVVSLHSIRRQYTRLCRAFPSASMYYAVKANPEPEILRLLYESGCSFDIASTYELETVLMCDIPPEPTPQHIVRSDSMAFPHSEPISSTHKGKTCSPSSTTSAGFTSRIGYCNILHLSKGTWSMDSLWSDNMASPALFVVFP